jgi:signal transduction histidine kinase
MRIIDQGPGVAPEDRTRIFGRFQRGSNAGTSEPPPGATFAFSLPAELVNGPV